MELAPQSVRLIGMRFRKRVRHGILGATAVVAGNRPVAATARLTTPASVTAHRNAPSSAAVAERAGAALVAFTPIMRPLSHSRALETAVRSYFAYRAATPSADQDNGLLYFVDYGLPSSEPRGYILDMKALAIVEGPFTVAHGRGSSAKRAEIPTRFSNAPRSAATSLGLYRAEDVYDFVGSASGRPYRSIGLRLTGLSSRFNDNALARHVVAHGAPYVTRAGAGRSEGCPAMEPERARRLLPMLAGGGMVFLFAPDEAWMAGDPWIAAGS